MFGILGVLFDVLGVLVGALGVLVGVLVLFGVSGVFLAYRCFGWRTWCLVVCWHTLYIFGVIGVCGIGMLYLLHLEFGLVHLFSSQKILFSEKTFLKAVHFAFSVEKGTPA